MISGYYSQLDLIQKYNFKSSFFSKNLISKIEVSFKDLEKERIDNKNADIEILNFFYMLFFKTPELIIKDKNQENSKSFYKKISIHNQKLVKETIDFIVKGCSVSNENIQVIEKDKGYYSVIYSFNLLSQSHLSQFPLPLVEESGYEIPSLKIEIFLNKTPISNFNNIYPLWIIF